MYGSHPPSHKGTLPKVTLAYRLLVAAPAKVRNQSNSYHDKELSLRTFPWMPLQGICSRLRSPKALPQTPYQALLLIAPLGRLCNGSHGTRHRSYSTLHVCSALSPPLYYHYAKIFITERH
jgi:hypothetical protein